MCVKIREFQCIYIYTSAASVSPTTHSHICMGIHSHSLLHYANIFLVLLSQPLLLLFLLMILLLDALGFQNDYFCFWMQRSPHTSICMSFQWGWQCVWSQWFLKFWLWYHICSRLILSYVQPSASPVPNFGHTVAVLSLTLVPFSQYLLWFFICI